MILNCIWWWGSRSRDLKSEEYSFIAINLHPSPFRPGMVVPFRFPSMSQLSLFKIIRIHPIYPTPPLGQDMTQGQFLSGV